MLWYTRILCVSGICRDYVLFDSDFHRVNREMINGYRVEVDTYGRHAILNTASQKSLNFSLRKMRAKWRKKRMRRLKRKRRKMRARSK